MFRKVVTRAFVVLAVLVPTLAFADAYDDLMKVQTAFENAKSWHAEEHFSNGRTVVVEYSAPDKWRIQPSPTVTELLIGSDIYMVNKGHATKLPFGGGMVKKIIQDVGFSAKEQQEIKQTAKDLGMQTIDGQSVHAYSYTAHDTPMTLYVGADSLPAQSVVQGKKMTTTIVYSKYNTDITIAVP